MRLKWTDDKTGEKLSYKIHFKQIYPNGNQDGYYKKFVSSLDTNLTNKNSLSKGASI